MPRIPLQFKDIRKILARFPRSVFRRLPVDDILFSGTKNISAKIPGKQNILGKLIKGTKDVPVENLGKYTSLYRNREMDIFARKAAREALRKQIGKGSIRSLFNKKYNKLLGSQTKGYANEVAQDFKNPLKSFMRQSAMVTHHVAGATGKVTKRSPLGKALIGAELFALPLVYAADPFTNKENKDMPTREKIIRASAGLLPMASPKALPSLISYEIPDLIYRKKKLDSGS